MLNGETDASEARSGRVSSPPEISHGKPHETGTVDRSVRIDRAGRGYRHIADQFARRAVVGLAAAGRPQAVARVCRGDRRQCAGGARWEELDRATRHVWRERRRHEAARVASAEHAPAGARERDGSRWVTRFRCRAVGDRRRTGIRCGGDDQVADHLCGRGMNRDTHTACVAYFPCRAGREGRRRPRLDQRGHLGGEFAGAAQQGLSAGEPGPVFPVREVAGFGPSEVDHAERLAVAVELTQRGLEIGAHACCPDATRDVLSPGKFFPRVERIFDYSGFFILSPRAFRDPFVQVVVVGHVVGDQDDRSWRAPARQPTFGLVSVSHRARP